MPGKMKVSLEGKRNEGDYYSNWEINDLSSQLSSVYYKHQILFHLNKKLNEGTSLKNIICFDKSINVASTYKKYKSGELSFSDIKDMTKIYYLGNPVTFEPNRDIELSNDIFTILRNTYSLFNRKDIEFEPLNRNLAIERLFSVLKSEISDKISVKMIEELIYLLDLANTFIPDEELSKLPEGKRIEIQARKKQYSELKNRFFSSRNRRLKQSLEKLDADFDKKEFSSDEIVKQIEKFINLFKTKARPIIGVYENSDKIKLLGTNMFVQPLFSKENPEFLETNNIGQNSPLAVNVTLSAVFLGSIVSSIKEKIKLNKEKKRELEIEKNILPKDASTISLDNRIAKKDEEIEVLEQELVKLNETSMELENENVAEFEIDNINLKELDKHVTEKNVYLQNKLKISTLER